MADSWWDTLFNPQGLRDYQRISPPEPKPLDRLVNPADDKAWWYGDRTYGEKLDPGELGIYGTPQPAGTPRYQPEGRDVVLPSRPPQRFIDRSRYVNQFPEARLTNELMNRHKAGQLTDREAYEILNSPEFTDENTLGAFHEMQSQGQGGSYLTRISDGGGVAPAQQPRSNYLSNVGEEWSPSQWQGIPGMSGELTDEELDALSDHEKLRGLPKDVIRNIFLQPSYEEGETIPRPIPRMEEEYPALHGPQTDAELRDALRRGRMSREENIPRPISDVRPSQDQYRRLPLASGIAPLPSARGFEPLIDLSGSDISTQGRRFERFDITRPGPYQLRGMYRKTFPF